MRGSVEREAAAAPSPPQKKQVRRRVHTRKPYQEKLLNMAEARREIVTALKLHRASKHPPPPPPPNFFSSPSYYNNNCCCNTPPPPIYEQNVDFALPHQPLGLNLNLDDFIMTSPSSIYSPSASPLPPAPAAEGFEFVGDHGVTSPFDDVMEEFPAWLNDTTTNYLQQQQLVVVLQDDFSNFQHPPALPCMDIEEIEGIDGDWLA